MIAISTSHYLPDWLGDEPGESQSITYNELHRKTCQIANLLKMQGVQKGDVVTIYMPMIPETAMTILGKSFVPKYLPNDLILRVTSQLVLELEQSTQSYLVDSQQIP